MTIQNVVDAGTAHTKIRHLWKSLFYPLMGYCYYYYLQFKSIQAQYKTAVTSTCALERQTADHMSVCNQKLPWPGYCIKGFCRFPESLSKSSVGAHITRFTTCYYQNLVHTHRASIQILLLSPPTQNSPIPVTLISPLPNALPCLSLPLAEGQVGTVWEPAEPQNAFSHSLPHFNWATQTSEYQQDCFTCRLLQQAADTAETRRQRQSCELT
jgi:hypothetical protein